MRKQGRNCREKVKREETRKIKDKLFCILGS
jgi:hypothetical protein